MPLTTTPSIKTAQSTHCLKKYITATPAVLPTSGSIEFVGYAFLILKGLVGGVAQFKQKHDYGKQKRVC